MDEDPEAEINQTPNPTQALKAYPTANIIPEMVSEVVKLEQ